MGFTVEWAMVRAEPEQVEDLLRTALVVRRSAVGGWVLARAERKGLMELARSLAAETRSPALAGWFHDSDYGFLAGVGPDGESFELLIGRPYGIDASDEHLRRLETGEGRCASVQALREWSDANVARPVDVAGTLQLLEEADDDKAWPEEVVESSFGRWACPTRRLSSTGSEHDRSRIDSPGCEASLAMLSGARKRTKR